MTSLAAAVAAVLMAVPAAKGYREHLCLATNIYFEARGELLRGQLAVKDVTKNRGRPTCKVVFEPKQFSWTHQKPKHVIDSFLRGEPKLSNADLKSWAKAKEVARSRVVVLGPEYLHYHAVHVNPHWSTDGVVIGKHKFLKGVKR